MTLVELAALGPLLVLLVTVIVLLGVASFGRQPRLMAGVAVVGQVAAAVLALTGAGWAAPVPVTELVVVDAMGNVMFVVAALSAAVVSLYAAFRAFALAKVDRDLPDVVELHLLVTITALGAGLLAWSSHTLSLLLGLEIAAVSYTGAVAWRRDERGSVEGAVKLLVMGAVATAFVLFGAALAYAETGELSLRAIGQASLLANALVLIGVGIKLGAVPFHGWVADGWQGATGPVALLLGTTAKAGLLTAALRIWGDGADVLLVVAMLSMGVGGLLGLGQRSARRLLAASSIQHMGDLLLGVAIGGEGARQAVLLYVVGYVLSQAAVFFALEALADGEEADDLVLLRGIGPRRPVAATLLTIGFASLAGLPFTAGFLGKLALVQVAVGDGRWGALGLLVVGSVLGGAAYLRVLSAVWAPGMIASTRQERPGALVVAGALALAVVLVGVLPQAVVAGIWLYVG